MREQLLAIKKMNQHRHISEESILLARLHSEVQTPQQLPGIGLIIPTLPELIHTSQERPGLLSFAVAAPQSAFLSVWWSAPSLSLGSRKELLIYFLPPVVRKTFSDCLLSSRLLPSPKCEGTIPSGEFTLRSRWLFSCHTRETSQCLDGAVLHIQS